MNKNLEVFRVEKEEQRKSRVTIYCKDGSVRNLTPTGSYNSTKAIDLGKDLEGGNFLRAEAFIL